MKMGHGEFKGNTRSCLQLVRSSILNSFYDFIALGFYCQVYSAVDFKILCYRNITVKVPSKYDDPTHLQLNC